MAFKREPQVFPTNINILTFGTGGNEINLGGENVLPFYSFDAPIEHRPKVGVAISDLGYQKGIPGIEEYYKGAQTLVDMAKRQTRVIATDKPVENEKFVFRCFLLRLGFIGDEYASARKILLKNLSGNAYVTGKKLKKLSDEVASEAEAEEVSPIPPEPPPDSKGQFSFKKLVKGLIKMATE